MKNVLVVDYKMGNIDSIVRGIEECGEKPIVSNRPEDFQAASSIILPGVGSFTKAMENIHKYGLEELLRENAVDKKKPLLGICLGMQILASKGFEGGETPGLGLIEGEVVRFQTDDPEIRIPHVGWNEVIFAQNSPLFNNIESGRDFYFVHSYHFICADESISIAYTPYCGDFTSVVCKGNIFGTQFHPEKSQRVGLQLLKNFLII